MNISCANCNNYTTHTEGASDYCNYFNFYIPDLSICCKFFQPKKEEDAALAYDSMVSEYFGDNEFRNKKLIEGKK
jgi:hypothetical protein